MSTDLGHWALAMAAYASETYELDPAETFELADMLEADLGSEELGAIPAYVSVPVRVKLQAESRQELERLALITGAEPGPRADPGDARFVTAGMWADFWVSYLANSYPLSAAQRVLLWRRFLESAENMELGERHVRFLAVPLQESLPLPDPQ